MANLIWVSNQTRGLINQNKQFVVCIGGNRGFQQNGNWKPCQIKDQKGRIFGDVAEKDWEMESIQPCNHTPYNHTVLYKTKNIRVKKCVFKIGIYWHVK